MVNHQFQFTIQGTAGQRFAIQASTNLTDWTWLATNSLANTSTNFVDASAVTNISRFYRAVTLP
jgi:hypothetical protein